MEKDIALGKKIFRQHSITYYYSTFLFPKQVREKVYILYGFVRLADELVDNPQENPKEALHRFMVKVDKTWNEGVIEDECDEEQQMISAFVRLAKREHFEKQWVDAFLTSMQMDLTIQTYDSMEDLDVYIYGSACVIGLMMAKIMGVPNEGLSYAEQLGRLMQLINFSEI